MLRLTPPEPRVTPPNPFHQIVLLQAVATFFHSDFVSLFELMFSENHPLQSGP